MERWLEAGACLLSFGPHGIEIHVPYIESSTGGICVCVLFTCTFFSGPSLYTNTHKHSHSGVLSSRSPAGLIISGHKLSKSF